MAEKSRTEKVMEGMERSRLDEIRSNLNKELLTPHVCKALNCSGVDIQTWDCIQVKGGISGNQVYQITGQGTVGNGPLSWSLFLKILNQSTDTIGLSDTDWKREPLAYESGLLDTLPGNLRAAKCYRLDRRSDTEIWMWLEDASEPEDSDWPLERYGLAAQHVGLLNGVYLLNHPLPSHNWLVREFERTAIPRDCNIKAFNLSLDYLKGKRFLSSSTAQSATRLWQEKEDVLARLYDHLPQTFSHFDADRRNVFSQTNADGIVETVAIDWGLVGIGPIGGELKNLVFFNLCARCVEIDRGEELYSIALDGYLKGLKDAEWKGNPDWVRYGCAFTTGLWILRLWSLLGDMIPDKDKRARYEQGLGCPFDETMEVWAKLTSISMELVDEGRKIGPTLF